MKKISVIVVLAAAILFFDRCASTGLTASSHLTNVQLSDPDFRVVATNVSGQASSKGILGVSYGLGIGATQLTLIPLTEDRLLYKNAMEKLWASFESKNGPVAGRKLALVNLRYDSETFNLFLYTKLTTVIVADVVEFQ